MFKVKSIVFGATEHGEKKLGHPHLVATAILAEHNDDKADQEECKYDEHWPNVVTIRIHSNRNSDY